MRKRNFIHFVYTCLVLLIGTTDIYGQLDVQQLTDKQGLGNNTINGIHQDRTGFLWIGTDIGITRYDGNFFHTFNLSHADGGEPISVFDIQETQDRFLWVVSKENDVACFDKRQERYLPIQWNNEIKQEDILKLYSTGNTLYTILTDGLYELDVKSDGKMISLGKKKLLANTKLNTVITGNQQTLFLTDKGNQLIAYDTQSGKSYVMNCQDWGIHTSQILNLYAQNEYLFIYGGFEGIVCYGLKEKSFRLIRVTNNQADYKQPNIREICYMKDHRFSIYNKRFIYEMKFENEDYLHADYEIIRRGQYERQFEKLIRNRITKLHYDTDNHVLWIGTYGNGLVRQNVSHSFAFRIALPDNIYHINDILQDAEGYIWLGTRKHGVMRSVDTEVSEQTRFVNWEHADADGSYHLQKDRNGFIWIGSEQGTIQKLNPMTKELTTITPPDSITDVAKDLSVRNLFMNSRNRLWVATENNIGIYDENTNRWLIFRGYHQPYGKVTCITEDAEGVMWLGTEHGLYEAHVPLDAPNKINMTGGFEAEAGLKASQVLSMHVTNTNQILVSYPDKIVRMEKNKVINHAFLQKDIPYGHITCMIDDRNGNTWAGSNESVISIHNKTAMYFSYPFSGNEPTVCRLNDSKLLWGNMPDLLFFDPVKLKDLPRKKVHITDIEVNARKIELPGQAIHDAKEIELTAGDHVRFLFSKLNYNAAQNKTIYRVLPIDTLWKEKRHNEIVLDQLEAGKYTLEIKPVYPVPGGEEVTSLKLNVSYHWVFSPWALLAYSLLIVTGAVLVYRYLHYRKKRRALYLSQRKEMEDKLQEVNERKEQEEKAHQLRSNIQASIAKDLRTPLSIISNSLKEVMGDKDVPLDIQQKFKLAHRNSLYIQDACEQLVNIHKQDICKQKLEVSSCLVFRITDSVIRSAREIISSCPININYGETKDQTLIWVDYAKIEFVIQNMLTNAFRCVRYAGNIQCSIDREILDGQEYCVFRIVDDGKDVEALLHQGYVLGQALMEDIARMHHGKFCAIREDGKGTESALYIPMGRNHFEHDKNVTFVENISAPITEGEPLVIPVHSNIEGEEDAEMAGIPQTKYQVLVVEDHKDTRTFLKLQLGNDYTVHLARNGQEGLEKAKKVLPDLIVTEVDLSGVNGYELTRYIKEDADMCHIPVILMTTLTDNEDIIKGMELGADDYIRKPYDVEVLKSKIKRLIKNRIELKRAYTKLLIPIAETDASACENQSLEKNNMEDPLITKMIMLINDNIQNEDFSVKKLAEMLNMSQPTLYRKVKLLTNFTLVEIVRGVRLKKAAELLKSKKYNVQEAAEAVGYNDIPTFRKHFVDLYGITPSAFSKEDSSEKK